MNPSLSLQRPRHASPSLLPAVLLGLLAFALGFGLTAWRIDQAPDIFTDEIIYTRLGVRVAGEGALVWDSGEPFLVHPPLYFLAEGLYLYLAGDPSTPLYGAGDIFASVYAARLLNAFFAGLTAALLFFTGQRLRSRWLGLFLVALFVLDPFALRINRRAMLETLAAFLSLLGVFLLLKRQDESAPTALRRALLAGLAFGLGLLAKELTLVSLLSLLPFGAWELLRSLQVGRRISLSGLLPDLAPIASFGVAALTYSLYPLWVFAGGNWFRFAAEKALAMERLLGLVQITGWNRPGISFIDLLLRRLADYGSSYLLLACGGLAALWLLWMGRNSANGRLLGAWGLVAYPFFTFVALFGSGNDQFFYFLLVAAIVLIGYALTVPIRWRQPRHVAARLAGNGRRLPAANLLIISALLLAILPYNALRWAQTYGSGQDRAYRQLVDFVRANLSPQEPLNASGDAVKFHYFFPQRRITDAATPEEARSLGVRYYVLAPKDVALHYGRIRPELASWIESQGTLLFAANGDSYGKIYLYRVDGLPPGEAPLRETSLNTARWRSFAPARGGACGALAAGLAAWIALVLLAAVGFSALQARLAAPRPGASSQVGESEAAWPAEWLLELEREHERR